MLRSVAVVALVALAGAGCGSTGSGGAVPSTTVPASTAATIGDTAPLATGPDPTSPPTTLLAGATAAPKSAPTAAHATALLIGVRVTKHRGFERIVFQFKGAAAPGYRVGWASGSVTVAGSGTPVVVAGAAHLQIVLAPASGVDQAPGGPKVTYTGPARVPVPVSGPIRDLIRTGDSGGELTCVAGTVRRRGFRVLVLAGPARVVVDLPTG